MKKLNVDEKIMYKKLSTIKSDINDYFYNFGYKYFGPFLIGYCMWILENLNKNGIKRVYFLSRDGYIMKKIFDIINESDIKSYYLEVSRRSLRVPSFYLNNDYSNICNNLPDSKLISIQSFFEILGLDINKYVNHINKYGFTLNDSFEKKDVLYNKKIMNLYDNLLKKDVKNNSKIEYNNLVLYLNEKEIEGKFAIVDIGWAGSMQRYLSETLESLKINHEIYGYYIGIADYYKKNIRDNVDSKMYGYLFDYKNGINQVDYRKPFVGLFETLFLEQNGSVNRYEKNGNKMVAIRDNYEYIINGKKTPEALNVEKIQDGAIDFTNNNKKEKSKYSKYTPYVLFYDIYKIGINPTLSQAKIFGDFKFYDNGIITYLAKRNKSINLKKDFLSSRWKIGYLKRLFKIKLPYEKIFYKLYKLK